MAATFGPACALPTWIQFLRPTTTGRIEFSVGLCELKADEAQGVLTMRVRAANEADLNRLEDVVARHLVRFAFRETLDLAWSREP